MVFCDTVLQMTYLCVMDQFLLWFIEGKFIVTLLCQFAVLSFHNIPISYKLFCPQTRKILFSG